MFTAIAVIIVLCVTVIFAKLLYNVFVTGLTDTGIMADPHVASIKNTFDPYMDTTLDLFPMFIFFGIGIVVVISSWFIPSSPAFLWINIALIPILIVLAVVFSNFYGSIIQDPGISGYMVDSDGSQALVRTTFIAQYLPWMIVVIAIVATVAMYAKGKSEGGLG